MSTARRLEPEIMDDPALDPAEHDKALRGLARLNRASLASQPIANAILRMLGDKRVVELLDVATGSGDVALGVVRRLQARRVDVRTTLVDFSDRALDTAAARWRDAGADVRTARVDVLESDPPACDIAMCSLFFHHLTEDQATAVLRRMSASARVGVVVNDLRRCGFGTLLATAVPRVMTTSRVVHTDAVLSARAALTERELAGIAEGAGLGGFRIGRAFPARMMFMWKRPT